MDEIRPTEITEDIANERFASFMIGYLAVANPDLYREIKASYERVIGK